MSSETPTKTVVFALDQSAASQEAFDWMLTYHINAGDHVVLAHVHPEVNDTALLVHDTKSYQESYEKSQKFIEEHTQKVAAKNIKADHKLLVGDPRQALCDLVEEVNAQSLVMGARGMGPLKRALLGSVSTYCVQYAKCPVTIIKAKST